MVAVNQYDKKGEHLRKFGGVTEAAQALGISSSGIYACCRHEVNSSNGFIWRYDNDMTPLKSPPVVRKIRPIDQLKLDGTLVASFRSIREAMVKTGTAKHGINSCINGNKSDYNGYVWRERT